MAAVTEAEMISALYSKMMTAAETINVAYSASGSPAWETAVAFPSKSRTEKFLDFDGTNDYYTVDLTGFTDGTDRGVVSFWIRPDFDQSAATLRFVYDSRDAGSVDGVYFLFRSADDDWSADVRRSNSTKLNTTTGETWSADEVIHMTMMWNEQVSLDGSKSIALYINGVLNATVNTNWSIGGGLGATSKIGSQTDANYKWDGGIFDWALIDYDSLSGTHTDQEIVDALYANTFDGGSYKFVYELSSTVAGTTTEGENSLSALLDAVVAAPADLSNSISIKKAGNLWSSIYGT